MSNSRFQSDFKSEIRLAKEWVKAERTMPRMTKFGGELFVTHSSKRIVFKKTCHSTITAAESVTADAQLVSGNRTTK